jgi:multicomponent Na+:H+ antiporter subunit D
MTTSAILSYWAPLVCLIALLIVVVVAYIYRSRGDNSFEEGTERGEIFLSGERVPEEGQRHIRSHNMYWGFFEAMKRYYDPTVRAHTGIINDYLIWLLAITAVAGIAIFAAGLM